MKEKAKKIIKLRDTKGYNFFLGVAFASVLILTAIQLRSVYKSDQFSFGEVVLNKLQSLTEITTANPIPSSQENADEAWSYYIPTTNFSSLDEEITFKAVAELATNPDGSLSNKTRILILSKDRENIEKMLGNKLSKSTVNNYDSYDKLLANIHTSDIALIPFELLTPKLKVISLDGVFFLDNKTDLENWPLKILSQSGTDPLANYQPEEVTTLAMTGVTAISRGVEAAITERNDPIFPALAVKDMLSAADITHVNSENPFFNDCVPEREGIVLCGKTPSIQALEAIGTDIVDLCGNHQNDYGNEKNLESISHLEDAGFEYFGGGKNQEDASKILYKTVNNTTLAFVGYAYFDSLNGPSYKSLAYKDQPGANYFSKDKLADDIAVAKENADLVIVDYQYIEEYSYNPIPGQIVTFRETIDLGADIVVGVQAHQPQQLEFYNNKPIFYGLGNFFFDQMWSEPTREGIIPKFYFYNGELISIRIYTTKLYDYAQPRFTVGEERKELLRKILPK